MNEGYQQKVTDKIAHIRTRPELHRHSFQTLHQCCMIDGILDSRVLEAHETYASLGSNGGQRCDVTSGPCSCGAWH